MSDIKKIMLAAAFSKDAQAETDFAVNLAKDLKADLIVAHIVNARDVEAVSSVEAMGYKVSTEDYTQGVKQERRAGLVEMLGKSAMPEEQVGIIIKVGHPFEQLLKIIDAEEIDLVVIGAKGRSDQPKVLLGSVAEKLFRHAPVPVVVFRTKEM